MLVLSRKKDQKVLLPGLGVTIQVIRCNESSVRLGFDAPPEIRIIRDELDEEEGHVYDGNAISRMFDASINELPVASQHQMRNKLNLLSIALELLKEEIDAGEFDSVENAFSKLVSMLSGSRPSTPEPKILESDKETVLVVEDQENEREMLAGILRMNGYNVVTAGDGIEALEYLEDNSPPTFVLVDMQMPRCDGAEVVRQIRETSRLSDIRLYVVSGSDQEQYDLKDDIDGWHIKPLDPSRLIDTMHNSDMAG